MRPLSLAFSGLNSYREKQTIDFDQLTNTGIFGIFGPTGAGKSSVLDAIALALYGKVDRARNKAQGIINLSENQCTVDFTFVLAAKKYRIQRVLEREKDKPFSSKTKSCRLYCLDDDTVLAEQAREVNEKIEQLLGMNFERFSQAVILPQGKFDAFLRLEPSERANFLEQLFHLNEYGENLSRKARNLLAQYSEQKALAQSRLEMMEDCSEDKIAGLKIEIDAKKEQLALKERTLEILKQELQKLHLLAEKSRQLQQLQSSLQELLAQKAQKRNIEIKVIKAQKAELLRPLIEETVNLVAQTNTRSKELESLQEAVKEAEAATRSASQNLLEAQQNLKNNRKDVLAAIENLSQLMEQEKVCLILSKQIKTEEESLQPLKSQENDLIHKQEILLDLIAKEEQEEGRLSRQKDDLYVKWQQADEAWRKQQKAEMAAFLAGTLEENQPCPVCGSLTHPQPQVADIDSSKLEMKKKVVQELQSQWRQTQQKLYEKSLAIKKLHHDLLSNNSELAKIQQEIQSVSVILDEHKKRQQELVSKLASAAQGQSIAKQKTLLQDRLDLWEKAEEESQKEQKRQELLLRKAKDAFLKTQSLYDDSCRRLAELKGQLLSKIAQQGFASAQEAKQALLADEQRQTYEKELAEYNDDIKEKNSRIKDLSQELNKSSYSDEKFHDTQKAVEEAEKDLQQLFAQVSILEDSWQKLMDHRELWHKLHAEVAALSKKEQLAKRLTKLFQGRAFVNFLAKEHLQQLLIAASAILAQLSNHRYLLEIFDDGKNNDFIMVDNYNGGGRRPVSTLSGGEIFLVSLSLALSLSARIQMQGAPLEFFFLDEGFGTLDPQKLEMVMVALELLPAGKRQVGIISHVQEIKNRLPRYLEAVPAGDDRGSSLRLMIN
ncbi:MAG: AAA family ATPase [Bacillota bacterium]|jgi:exonuclease SbcC